MKPKSKSLLSTSFIKRAETLANDPPHLLLLTGVTHIEASQAGEFLVKQICDQHSLKAAEVIRIDGHDFVMDELQGLTRLINYHFDVPVARVCFISHFDAVNIYVQNAMLKMVEQPPRGVIFVLSCKVGSNTVLGTIVSRAQMIRVSRPLPQEFKEALRADHASDAIDKALLLAKGNPLQAEALLLGNAPVIDHAKKFLSLHKYDRLTEIEAYSKDREAALDLVNGIEDILHYLLRQHAARSEKTNVSELLKNIEHTQRISYNITINGNVKLNLVSLCLHI